MPFGAGVIKFILECNGGEAMKTIGIIAAMKTELQFLKENLKNVSVLVFSGMPFYKGVIGKIEIVLTECGIGKVNAAIYTQMLIDKFQVDVIINTGIAGSLDDDVRHLSVVIANMITYYDVRKEQLVNCFPYQEFFVADEKLVQLLYDSSEKDSTKTGVIITGDDFISDKKKKEMLKKEYCALCVEMEGAAIAHAAYVNKIPFCIVRCISDMADESSDTDYQQYEHIAAKKVAKMVYKAMLSLCN